MNNIYITVTGLNHYHGSNFIEPKAMLQLVKDPDNEYDKEAIRVEMEGLGKIGYVANSSYTVLGDSMSAGRLYDRIGDTATAKVKFVLPKGIICKVTNKSILYWPPVINAQGKAGHSTHHSGRKNVSHDDDYDYEYDPD